MTIPRIGWIGLGHMGLPMVARLVASGAPVMVWNRSIDKTSGLGCRVAGSPSELARAVDVIVTMVSDDAAQDAVLFGPSGVSEGVSAGKTVINMGTISPGASVRAADRLGAIGVSTLDAPVSGSVKPATDGTLVILVGGDPEVFERSRPIFDVLGKRAFLFGPHGQGARAKLAINMILGLTIQALAEAEVLGEACGLDKDTLLDMIAETAVASPIVKMKLPTIRADDFKAAFPLRHMAKDFRLAVAEAEATGARLPLTLVARDSFAKAEKHGLGDQDIMAILRELRGPR